MLFTEPGVWTAWGCAGTEKENERKREKTWVSSSSSLLLRHHAIISLSPSLFLLEKKSCREALTNGSG